MGVKVRVLYIIGNLCGLKLISNINLYLEFRDQYFCGFFQEQLSALCSTFALNKELNPRFFCHKSDDKNEKGDHVTVQIQDGGIVVNQFTNKSMKAHFNQKSTIFINENNPNCCLIHINPKIITYLTFKTKREAKRFAKIFDQKIEKAKEEYEKKIKIENKKKQKSASKRKKSKTLSEKKENEIEKEIEKEKDIEIDKESENENEKEKEKEKKKEIDIDIEKNNESDESKKPKSKKKPKIYQYQVLSSEKISSKDKLIDAEKGKITMNFKKIKIIKGKKKLLLEIIGVTHFAKGKLINMKSKENNLDLFLEFETIEKVQEFNKLMIKFKKNIKKRNKLKKN
ncbi:hypothetical protein M0813_16289 [Anaeramoeba flamelloides]|uniref:Uncharacterized protein n=1 Tax=Anaeramoeba flamelloides TaxID=1746091 RepID=A0ABQ8Z020_9EUKA|nr:hypothetical protein M0813_16289 [Anaeramoeba flamelloides]